ncbi:MAG: SpoIID/LytB domain-containing protein [Bacillota bacterium]|jgi:stage II sporulation protein D|nr:SpoIID/LytB domain-containing protein [Candidatus Fermentithermobacillaceae bacterium]
MIPGGKKKAAAGLWRAVLVVTFVLYLALHVGSPEATPALLAGGSSPSGPTSPEVLVGLFRTQSVSFGCGGNWSLTCSNGERVSLKAGSSLTLDASGSRITWTVSGGSPVKSTESGNLLVSPASPDGPFISVTAAQGAGTSYRFMTFRGSMVVMVDEGGLLVANAIDMEEYVQSVVGGEVIDSWPVETFRAQAVAVRSYAAHKTGLRRDWPDRDYVSVFASLRPEDVLIWSHDQVYRGIGEETAATRSATLSTRGQVLTHGGLPAATYYHSDAGGMTEDPCYVWGRGVPYLVAVEEPPHESPHSSWTVTLKPEDLTAAADRLGLSLPGPVDALRGLERGVSGRWFTVSLGSGSDFAPVRGNDLRAVLPQIKSTLFSAYTVGGGRPTEGSLSSGMCFSVAGSAGVVHGVHLGSSYIAGKSGEPLPPPDDVTVLSETRAGSPPYVVLQGSGWGHGVGLSQWGARGLALEGRDAREILNLYYPSTTLEQWW